MPTQDAKAEWIIHRLLNTPSGGAPPASHFTMCRVPFFLKIRMHVFGRIIRPGIISMSFGVGLQHPWYHFLDFSSLGPTGKQSCIKSQSRGNKYYLLPQYWSLLRSFLDVRHFVACRLRGSYFPVSRAFGSSRDVIVATFLEISFFFS